MARVMRRLYDWGQIRRERVLPLPGDVLVEEGQVVEPGTILAETEIVPGDPYVIDIGSRFKLRHIDPEVMETAILKKVGDRISRGEVVVRMPSGGPLGQDNEAESPVDGVVEFVSYAKGRLLVREEVKSARPVEVVNVAKQLGIWPALVRMHMRYREGDEVSQGSILAVSPEAFKMGYVYSPVNGTIERVDAHTGNVYLVRRTSITQVRAYIPGTVERIIPERGAVILGEGATAHGVFGVGGERFGPLRVAVSAPDELMTARAVEPEDRGAVLVAGSLVTAEALERAQEVGVSAVITGGIHQGDLVNYVGHEIEGAVTGNEDVEVTVIITEGFGEMTMAPALFQLLVESQGSQVSCNGRTQIRAGAVRPEIIVSTKDRRDKGISAPALEALSRGELSAGQTVRVTRGPHFGSWGRVATLESDAMELESEVVVPTARVRLDSGEEVTVIQDNLEVFSTVNGGGQGG